MFYSIRHRTQFRYSSEVSESQMEVRMHPRTEGPQRCLTFQLSVSPKARVMSYRDYLGNTIHHFNVPGDHTELSIVAEALVDVLPPPEVPESLGSQAWQELDMVVSRGDYWEMLLPSQFGQPTPALEALVEEFDARRREDPMTLIRELNRLMSESFAYVPKSTRVDSPIDHAIESRKGVCQDFAHIMLALLRGLRIPSRYVSGYVCRRAQDHDRSGGASHAWVEALLPGLGWIGFDPTNNLLAGERHIRTAIGRDYADVPPTRGIFKGAAKSELAVSVQVALSDSLPRTEEEIAMSGDWSTYNVGEPDPNALLQQQQQQQQ